MNYKTKVKLITISMIASSFLVGCGGGGDTTSTATSTTVAGVAVDPELQGATVFLDANEDGNFTSGELSTITDNLGNYSLEIPDADIGKPLIVTGGVDRVTGKSFVGKQLSAVSQAGLTSQHITPLTTLVQKQFKDANGTKSLNDIKTLIETNLKLEVGDLDKNIVGDGNAKLLKVALRVQKLAEFIGDSSTSKSTADVYKEIANKIKTDSNLS